ncbi:shikimate dehydrogenase [Candidatus Peregrinibacteria bacterium]|nr:shikimate dehydrogenase [Candidatus Peregrinibacteria bacterium]
MDIYGILAFPAHHSLSPAMHNAGFKTLNLNAQYKTFEVPENKLKAFIKDVRKKRIKGLSVSKPHKQEIMPLLDMVDPTAEEIGAVNTVYWENDKLIGTNVDWIGVEQALLETTFIEGKDIVILGAGGAARAAIYALKENQAESITVLNRTLDHAKELANEFICNYGNLEEFASVSPDIVIQATSAGLNKKEGVEIIPGDQLTDTMVVMEMIYTPRNTRIIRDAQKAGAQTITGERMLLHQGAAAFSLWTSQKAPFAAMEKAVESELS